VFGKHGGKGTSDLSMTLYGLRQKGLPEHKKESQLSESQEQRSSALIGGGGGITVSVGRGGGGRLFKT